MSEQDEASVQHEFRPRVASMRRLTGGGQTADKTEATATPGFAAEGVRKLRVTRPQVFAGRKGFDRSHLGGFKVDLPSPNGAMLRDVVSVAGDKAGRLDYEHFSVVMRASRRMALFTAVNVEGLQSVSLKRSNDAWSLDGRIPLEFQIGEELYSGNRLDRGHLVRREDPNWGDAAEIANGDTFHFTNCCPQMDVFNQREWLGLENYILKNARAWRERCSVITGPVFGENDLQYRGIFIPREFWKVVAFLDDDGKPSATAYLLTQNKDLTGLEAAFGAYKTYQRSVRSIEELSGLTFNGLADYDGFSNEEAITGLEIASSLKSLSDVRV